MLLMPLYLIPFFICLSPDTVRPESKQILIKTNLKQNWLNKNTKLNTIKKNTEVRRIISNSITQ